MVNDWGRPYFDRFVGMQREHVHGQICGQIFPSTAAFSACMIFLALKNTSTSVVLILNGKVGQAGLTVAESASVALLASSKQVLRRFLGAMTRTRRDLDNA
jgi:hypothetical protein